MPFALILSGTAQGVGLGGGSLPPTLFRNPDLSLTTQTRFSNLTILNTYKQRTGKVCLVAVANEFVAHIDNRKGIYSFKFWSNVGVGCNLLF